MSQQQFSATNPDARRGILVVLNERPPAEAGEILQAMETKMIEEFDRAVQTLDYEDLISIALAVSPDDPDRFQATLSRLEDRLFGQLKKRVSEGHMVLLSGWLREGCAGQRLLGKYLDIVHGTGCMVLWVNSTASQQEIRSVEWMAAITEDVRWGDDPDAMSSLSLIEPFEEPVGTLTDVKLKFFERVLDQGVDSAVEDLFGLVTYWDSRRE